MNEQPPEKRVQSYGAHKCQVHSIFYTIQGEGPFCGTPAVFIRLAGCNLQCPKCDTDYTSKRELMDPDQIIAEVKRAKFWYDVSQKQDITLEPTEATASELTYSGLIVITGGEPFRQDLGMLFFHLLKRLDCYIQVETNGTLPPSPLPAAITGHSYSKNPDKREGVYIVVSPKTGKVHPLIERQACAYKYVMADYAIHPKDGLPTKALDHSAAPMLARPPADFSGPVYLQPVDEGLGVAKSLRNREHLRQCVKSCMKHGYILQLQIHKLIGVE